jgi:two-component system repressor protein LuxO
MADVLVIEDIPSNAEMYRVILERAGHSVRTVETMAAAKAAMDGSLPDAVLLDLQLPDGNGLDLLHALRASGTMVPTVVLTGNGSVQRAVEAMQAGAIDFLMKPCAADKLTGAVGQAVARWTPSDRDAPDNVGPAQADRGPSGFIGESLAMRNVFALIDSAAGSSAPVFITGESGTGKELCARAIHEGGPRRNGPFVPLNCAAIPRELIESEIFGHRKGAFTGAVENREGAASLADGGTLFLDEICEMDLDLQAKLLRLVQQGTFKRVGDTHEREVDIRFVCATNRDPLAELRAGRFREDLYYRLHVVPLAVPPLRERLSDIRVLAERFLADFATVEGKAFRGLTDDAMRALEGYTWPGNVRELENVIRSVTVLNRGTEVTRDMLPAHIRDSCATAPVPDAPTRSGANGTGHDADASDILVQPLDRLEILAIDAAIARFDGNITRAAQALDISTSTIYRKKQSWRRRHGTSEDRT